MSHLLFGLLLVTCAAVVVQGVIRRGGLYSYPTLCALVVLGWVAPQLRLLVDFPDLPHGALDLTLIMIVLSVAAIVWGWHRGSRAPSSVTHHEFDTDRLLIAAVALSLFGAFFRMMIRSVSEELLQMSQWSGPQTIYVFLAGTQDLALALAWLLFLRTGRRFALAVVVFNLAFHVDAILLYARRGTAIEVGLIILVGLWLARRWFPSRVLLLAGALAAAFLVNVITEYRMLASAQVRDGAGNPLIVAWQTIKQIDPIESLQGLQQYNPRMMELYNAVHVIGATHESLDFEGPATYWDRMIFQYVPGQIIGFALKQSLMFSTSDPMLDVYGLQKHVGTTTTGFADAFRAFWFLGAIVFFGFAWLMRVCWERGMQGQLLFQFLYLVLMKDALHAITHSTSWFVASWPFLIVFSLPLFWFARMGTSSVPTIGRRPVTSGVRRPLRPFTRLRRVGGPYRQKG